jgi:hypothetical protein
MQLRPAQTGRLVAAARAAARCTTPASRRPTPAARAPRIPLQRGAARRDAARELVGKWPTALLEHPAVCEDPAVLLRLLATGRALGDEAAAAASGRLRLALNCEYAIVRNDPPGKSSPADRARRALCREQAAFVERRGALLAELVVADDSVWHYRGERVITNVDRVDSPLAAILLPALQRAAAAGRLPGLRALELPGFGLEGGALLGALALCPALTRLRLGTFDTLGYEFDAFERCVYVGADGHPSAGELRAAGRQLAALRGLRELDVSFGCMRAPAPALAGLSALTRLTRLRLTLVGNPEFEWAHDYAREGMTPVAATREWCGLHKLPASLLDLSLDAACQARCARARWGVHAAGRSRWLLCRKPVLLAWVPPCQWRRRSVTGFGTCPTQGGANDAFLLAQKPV